MKVLQTERQTHAREESHLVLKCREPIFPGLNNARLRQLWKDASTTRETSSLSF